MKRSVYICTASQFERITDGNRMIVRFFSIEVRYWFESKIIRSCSLFIRIFSRKVSESYSNLLITLNEYSNKNRTRIEKCLNKSLMKKTECDSVYFFVNRTPFVLFSDQTACSAAGTVQRKTYSIRCSVCTVFSRGAALASRYWNHT